MITRGGRAFAEELAGNGLFGSPVVEQRPAAVPCVRLTPERWAQAARIAKEHGWRFVAEWAAEEPQDYSVYAAYAKAGQGYAVVRTEAEREFPSLARIFVAASRMERVMHDLYGLIPADHPDLRPWIHHEHWPAGIHPLRKDFDPATRPPRVQGQYPFIEAEGEGVYEIPVGPVHAGIVEPGHFRFLAVGEQILNLEERLGYVHKGIEKRFEGRDAFTAARLAARISGDANVAHTWALCQAMEAAAGVTPPPRALALRAVLLERERLANHIGDIGFVCNDAAWGFMHMQCQRLREQLARLHAHLFGHRLLMDTLVPGGVRTDMDAHGVRELANQTRAIAKELAFLREIYQDHTPIRERVVGSGTLTPDEGRELGLLGYAGRSATLDWDCRRDAAYAPYDRLEPRVAVCPGGDVAARLWVRFEEAAESARLIEQLLAELPADEILAPWSASPNGASGLGLVESWRGEILCWVRFTADGLLDRVYVRDPSMINWLGLELAVRSVPVPDFPLNNKSFNCSYAGHDL